MTEDQLRLIETAEARQEVLDLVAAVRRLRAPMRCGHPGACASSSNEGTAHCAACEREAKAVAAEREACADVADQEARETDYTGLDEFAWSIAAKIRARGRKE